MGTLFDGGSARGTAVDLRDPSSFVRSLGCKPTKLQQVILDNFHRVGTFRGIYDERDEIARACGLALLWYVLASRGAKGTLISSNEDTGLSLLRFIRQVIRAGPQSLLDICNFPDPGCIKFGSDPGWNITLLRDFDAKKAAKRGMHSKICLVLRENSSEIGFVEAKNALIGAMRLPGKKSIHLW